MSESDDTDVLLLIPPDLFTVASSGSSDSLENVDYITTTTPTTTTTNNLVVTNILEHVQYLENKINSIEMNDRTKQMDHSFVKPLPSSCHKYDLPICENIQNLSSSTTSSRINKSPSSIFKKYEQRSNQDYSTPSITKPQQQQQHISSLNIDRHSIIDRKINGNGHSSLSSSRATSNVKSKYIGHLLDDDDDNDDKIISGDYSYLKNNNQDRLLFNESKIIDKLKDNNSDYNYLLTRQQNENLRATSSPNKIQETQFKKNTESSSSSSCEWKSQKLLSLADFWEPDINKSEIERLRIKLEEEKFRRQHCEKLIQELQKKLLEQQEKVAVAIAIDKEKKTIISQYQIIINKLKDEWLILDNNYKKLKDTHDDFKSKHNTEINDLENKIKLQQIDKLKFNNLEIEYKEKCDNILREKIELIENHANELDNYKKFLTTAESRYEELKNNYDKLINKNSKLEETSLNYEQELKKEKLKTVDIHKEMEVIHKALDTCEAELSLLRQANENLQLRLKEEKDRCAILDGKKTELLEELNQMRKYEQNIKDQHEKKRNELRDIYQKQVDDVVQVKLKEFQSQLDSAESTFQNELETKQRIIAECAARKIKTIIDKHQLEINLIEEKHNEEKYLHNIQISQANNKIILLESKLNAQEAAKSRIAEELHIFMEKQWKQALKIISPTSDINQSLNFHDKIKFHNSSKNTCNNNYLQHEHEESLVTLTSTDNDHHNHHNNNHHHHHHDSPDNKLIDSKDDLKKCIQMILQMQENKTFNSGNVVENESSASPVSSRQVPRKYYTKADSQQQNAKNVSWEPAEVAEIEGSSITDTSIIHFNSKSTKPPWK